MSVENCSFPLTSVIPTDICARATQITARIVPLLT